jgi:hypothetical protein
VPRVDTAPSLADRVDPTLARPLPPAPGTAITQPAPPIPTPVPVDPGPWPGPTGQLLPELVTLDGTTLPAPADAVVRSTPPKPPVGPSPAPGPSPSPAPPLSGLVDKAYADKTAGELAAAPLTALKGISPGKAAALTEALGVDTIGELAGNRFVRAAQTITQDAASGP